MRFKNTTTYPDDEVKRLVQFGTKGVNLANVAVTVKNGGRGVAYDYRPHNLDVAPTVKRAILLCVEAPDRYPRTNITSTRKWFRHDTEAADAYAADRMAKGLEAVRGTSAHRRGANVRNEEYVDTWHPYGGLRSPLIEYADWREWLVGLAAHEARHIWQFQRRKPLNEADCERFALKAIERFRKSEA